MMRPSAPYIQICVRLETPNVGKNDGRTFLSLSGIAVELAEASDVDVDVDADVEVDVDVDVDVAVD